MQHRAETWVFDLDGTLVDSFSHYFEALREIFEQYGRSFSDAHHEAALTDPLHSFFARHLGSDAVPSAMERLQTRSNADAANIRPFDGVPELLEHLLSHGCRVGVWTNRDKVSAQLILEASGLSRFAHSFVSGNCVSLRKPHPEGLRKVMAELGGELRSVVMIGDHEHDVTAAKAVGVTAIRASWHSYWEVDRCRHADHQFHEMDHFAQWVRGQTGVLDWL